MTGVVDMGEVAGVNVDAVNLALAVLRASIGAMIIAHGWNHMFGGGGLAGTAGWFESMGLRPGRLHAVMASVVEIVAGVLLLLGLLVPFAAGAVLGVMVVAWITAHRTNGFFIFAPGQGWEYVMVVSAVCVAIGTVGPGQWSLDNALDLSMSGWWPLVVTVVVGLGGSLGLLAVFWRPGRTAG
jgi:putative oxidoreductase